MILPAQVTAWPSNEMTLRNSGGVALNVSGWIYWRSGEMYPWQKVDLVQRPLGPGLEGVVVAGQGVGDWTEAYGLIEYEDLAGEKYRCRWRISMLEGRRGLKVEQFGLAEDVSEPEPPEPLMTNEPSCSTEGAERLLRIGVFSRPCTLHKPKERA